MKISKCFIQYLAILALSSLSMAEHSYAGSMEAKRHMARGTAAMEMAKSPADFRDAVEEFSQAVKQMPDWANAWFNLGVAQESAEDYHGAIDSFKTYLKKVPKAADYDAVEARVFRLEYKMEKAGEILEKKRAEELRKEAVVNKEVSIWKQCISACNPIGHPLKRIRCWDKCNGSFCAMVPLEDIPPGLKTPHNQGADEGWGEWGPEGYCKHRFKK